MHNIDSWKGCYPSNWKGVIVPEAMAHPAKYSSKLIRRIYEHMITEGWVKPGDSVLDPFGGVALGALDAMRLGLNWYGNELEEKFFTLGNQNITLWNGKFSALPRWGSAHLFHGDSRHLLEVIGSVQASVSSPPYADEMSQNNGGRRDQVIPSIGRGGAIQPRLYGETPGQLGAMKATGFEASISSPPFLQSEGGYNPDAQPLGRGDPDLIRRHAAGNKSSHAYGESEGQLSSMKDGSFDVAVSSPPYNPPMSQDHNGSRGGTRGTTPSEPGAFVKYGNTEGQLEGMDMDGFSAAMKSPPYSAMQVEKNAKSIDRTKQYEAYKKSGGGQTFEQFCHTQELHSQGYGNSDGQLSAMPAGFGSFDAALSSPPYAQARIGQESGQGQCGHGDQYGGTDGQLGAMEAEGFEAAVSSPPFESHQTTDKRGDNHPYQQNKVGVQEGRTPTPYITPDTTGQLGNDSGDDFWLAARSIVEQVYQALAPGGHAVWVVKNYVKAKKIVHFCDQWRQLCEAVGFVTLHEHHASLIRNQRTQHTLDGGSVTLQAESKSFFRRLAEKNGSPRIDFETVFCMEKPHV